MNNNRADETPKPGENLVKIEKKSALPLWIAAAVWAIFGLFLPMYMWYHYVICAIVSIVAYAAASKLAPPIISYEAVPVDTGNEALNKAIREIGEVQISLSAAASASDNNDSARCIKSISDTLSKIEAEARRDPKDLDRVSRLMGYYLPTTKKLAEKYVYFRKISGGDDSTPDKTVREIENAFSMIELAMKKQLDAMLSNDALDISTDIDVLEGMLSRDGLS